MNPPRPVSLWVLIGLPGSGKSTWASTFAQTGLSLHLISTDQIRFDLYGNEAIQGQWLQIWHRVQQQFRQSVSAIHQGHLTGVIYDATNTRRRPRREVIQAAHQAGFTRILAIWIDTPLDQCLDRNQQRSRQVPTKVIHAMARQLAGAPPHCNEGFDALFRVR